MNNYSVKFSLFKQISVNAFVSQKYFWNVTELYSVLIMHLCDYLLFVVRMCWLLVRAWLSYVLLFLFCIWLYAQKLATNCLCVHVYSQISVLAKFHNCTTRELGLLHSVSVTLCTELNIYSPLMFMPDQQEWKETQVEPNTFV